MIDRSRGAGLLSRVGQTQAQLASRLGVSTGIVAMWISGQRKPGLPNRKMLLDALKIPIESWDEEVSTPASVPPPRVERDSQPWGEAAASFRIERLQRIVDAQLDQLDAPLDDMGPLEHAKVTTEVARNLDRLRALRGEALPEVKVLRLPAWIALRDRILAALKPHPDALRDVLDELDEDALTGT